ncbi:MAG: hypothetical protein IH986_11185 [Planctomycetes bacterium]|nr:hypothetical protein [Planctomycetota bacterium]
MAIGASQRRVLYGLNVGVSVVLATVVLVLAVYFSGRFRTQIDMTGEARLNSLSERTVKLVSGLDQNVTITGLYAVLSEYQNFAQKRADRVRDLLDLYESDGRGKVTANLVDPMKNPAKLNDLIQRLSAKSKYAEEAAPHKAALEKFPALNDRLAAMVSEHTDRFAGLEQTNPALAAVREYNIVRLNFDDIKRRAQRSGETIKNSLEKVEIPLYGRSVQVAREHLTAVRRTLAGIQGWFAGGARQVPNIQPDALAFFDEAGSAITSVLEEVDVFLNETQDLKPVKIEEFYDKLKRAAGDAVIVVEAENEARLLSLNDVWPFRTDRSAPPAPDNDPRDFAGEQAISSALLQLTRKDRTAVVFVYFGGLSPIRSIPQMNPMMQQRIPPAPYEALDALLKKQDFLTEDWDVKTTKTPPVVEDAARTIYVVLSPQPPRQPNAMMPSPEGRITAADKKLVTDAVEASGLAVFLAGWAPPTSPMLPIPGTYEYAEYLRDTWGVDVQYKHLALEFTAAENPDLWVPAGRNRNPVYIGVGASGPIHFTDHEITQPLRGLRAVFSTVAPLRIVEGDEKPANVTVEVVAAVEETSDVWAFDNLQLVQSDLAQKRGTRPREGDIRAPFPVAVTATDESNKRRVAIFASESFAADAITQASAFEMRSRGLVMYAAYPANSDLFVNTLHWLTGDADRISVGPRRGNVALLDGLKDDWKVPYYRGIMVGAGPLLALIVGGVVWMMRRR